MLSFHSNISNMFSKCDHSSFASGIIALFHHCSCFAWTNSTKCSSCGWESYELVGLTFLSMIGYALLWPLPWGDVMTTKWLTFDISFDTLTGDRTVRYSKQARHCSILILSHFLSYLMPWGFPKLILLDWIETMKRAWWLLSLDSACLGHKYIQSNEASQFVLFIGNCVPPKQLLVVQGKCSFRKKAWISTWELSFIKSAQIRMDLIKLFDVCASSQSPHECLLIYVALTTLLMAVWVMLPLKKNYNQPEYAGIEHIWKGGGIIPLFHAIAGIAVPLMNHFLMCIRLWELKYKSYCKTITHKLTFSP